MERSTGHGSPRQSPTYHDISLELTRDILSAIQESFSNCFDEKLCPKRGALDENTEGGGHGDIRTTFTQVLAGTKTARA